MLVEEKRGLLSIDSLSTVRGAPRAMKIERSPSNKDLDSIMSQSVQEDMLRADPLLSSRTAAVRHSAKNKFWKTVNRRSQAPATDRKPLTEAMKSVDELHKIRGLKTRDSIDSSQNIGLTMDSVVKEEETGPTPESSRSKVQSFVSQKQMMRTLQAQERIKAVPPK